MSRKSNKQSGLRQAAAAAPFVKPMPLFKLSRTKPTQFDVRPANYDLAEIAAFMGIREVRDLRLKGEIRPVGQVDWEITGRLTATTVQACVVSLDPVVQNIDEPVARRYVPTPSDVQPTDLDVDPEGDDDPDMIEDALDPGALALEVLALALDPYPRAQGAEIKLARAAPPGITPLEDAALKPFAGLADLKAKLFGGDD